MCVSGQIYRPYFRLSASDFPNLDTLGGISCGQMSIVHLHICVGENSELDFEIFSEAFSFWILESEGSNMVVLVGGNSWLGTIFDLKWNNNASVLE